MSALTCPYCYNSFPARQMDYRCTGLMGRNRKQCTARQRDPLLSDQLGVTTGLPPAFKSRRDRDEATCPQCQNPTRHRLCPHCHSQMPVHFGKIDSRMVAMIGAKYSGKTIYMTVLMHELMHRVGRRFDAAVVGSDDETRRAFIKNEQQLYDDRAVFPTTQSTKAMRKPPLVFKLSRNEQGRFGTRQRHTLMSFFDTAGEDLRSEDSVRLNVRYLGAAGGIILLLDPLQLPGARESVSAGATLPPLAPDADQPINVLARVTDLLHDTGHGGPGKLIDVPIAIAFSKVDMLWDGLAEDSPVRLSPPTGPAFSRGDCSSVHEYVRALLDRWGSGQIDQFLTTHYRDFRYFAVSALGAPPDGTQISGLGVRPHRVEDPFLWLLSSFKAIPTED